MRAIKPRYEGSNHVADAQFSNAKIGGFVDPFREGSLKLGMNVNEFNIKTKKLYIG
jgi:hypothetical protein